MDLNIYLINYTDRSWSYYTEKCPWHSNNCHKLYWQKINLLDLLGPVPLASSQSHQPDVIFFRKFVLPYISVAYSSIPSGVCAVLRQFRKAMPISKAELPALQSLQSTNTFAQDNFPTLHVSIPRTLLGAINTSNKRPHTTTLIGLTTEQTKMSTAKQHFKAAESHGQGQVVIKDLQSDDAYLSTNKWTSSIN